MGGPTFSRRAPFTRTIHEALSRLAAKPSPDRKEGQIANYSRMAVPYAARLLE